MAALTLQYGALTTITITLSSLQNDAALSSGRQSAAIDNSSICAVDYIVQGFISTGAAVTVQAKQVQVWAASSNDGTNFVAGLTSADAARNVCGQKTNLKLLEAIPTTSTVSGTYRFGGYSIANAFRGVVPKYWALFVVQSTCQILFSTSGTHEFSYLPVYYASTT